MAIAGEPIEAILKLNTQPFRKDLNGVSTAVTKFKESMVDIGTDSVKVSNGINQLNRNLTSIIPSLKIFTELSAGIKNFNTFANGVLRLSEALTTLGNTSQVNSVSIFRFKEIVDSLEGSFGRLNNNVARYNNLSNNISNASNNSSSSLKQMQQDLLNMGKGVQPLARVREQMDMMKAEFNQARSNMLQFANGGVEAFNKIDATSNKVKAQFNQMVAELEMLAWTGVEAFNKIETGEAKLLSSHQRENSALQQVIASDERLAGLKQQLAQSYNQESASSNRATASMKRQESASKTLKNSLGMLRNAVTLVGSMIAYNFVHNLAMATTETINAKSEMNGYFQMLGYTTKEVDGFNQALDETIKKFPRLNKYSLGETISSIGVEFELTTAEMKKAMPVVSMITSEYLRAGRNSNEASLAVKDILQGEFQRLSRETGVKADQLKEAGWSGDKNDVMGLLEALDKVGKSRNWDTFVVKANSLNDAVLILQNRFSEWSADMVEKVQPVILGVFNDLMVVGTDFGKRFNKVFDWLLGDGLGQSIVKWGGLATAIGLVTTAIIHARTGMGLMQISQLGLSKSILATILGLKAETLANYDLSTSITMAITGLKEEELANISNTKAIFSSILGLDLATVKQYGFGTALLSSITGIEGETIALEGLNAEMLLAIGSFTAMASVIVIATGVLVAQAIKIQNTTETYKKFVNMVDNGDDIIAQAKGSVDSLTNKKEKLTEKLATLEKGTYEYNLTANQLKVTTDDLTTATLGYGDAVNSVAWAKHKQSLYDEEKASAQAEAQKDINQALLDYGFNVQEASQLSNEYWNDAINGWNQHYETLQKVNLQYSKNATSVQYALDQLNNTKLEDKEVTLLIRRKITSGNKIANIKEELGNATSLTEYIDKWLWLQVAQVENAFVDFDINSASGGLLDGIEGLAWGLVHFLGDHFTGAIVQDLVEASGLKGIGSGFGDWFKDVILEDLAYIFSGDFLTQSLGDHTLGGDMSWLWETYLQPLVDFIQNGGIGKWIQDKLGNWNILDGIMDAIMPSPVSASDGSSSSGGHDYVAEFFDDPRITGFIDGIKSWVYGIPTMIKDTALNVGMSIVDFVTSLFSTDTSGIETWVQDNIITPLVNSVEQGVLNTPVLGDIAKFLGFGENPEQEAQNTGNQIGTGISQGTQQGLLPIPNIFNNAFGSFDMGGILSKFTTNTSTMTSNAQSTATNVATAFTTMKNNHKASVDSMVNKNTTAFNDMRNKSHNSMLQMRDSTSNVTRQMTNAWRLMKDNIVASANRIKTDSESRFNSLGKTIGSFYRKLQNPSLWGSGAGVRTYSRNPRPSVARSLFNTGGSRGGYHGAGYNPYKSSSNTTMPIKDLMKMMVNVDEDVNVADFLSLFTGGFGGWDFVKPHTDKIKSTSDLWKSASANIQGIGSVGEGYLVKRFNNGTPKFTWSEFLSTAQGIFSAIPYKFYYDSEWKGNWVNALLSGATNCSDGSEALIALASVFGFSGRKVHTTLKDGVGHFYAVINGHKMDTTHFQNSGSWSPLGGAGTPTRTSKGAGSSNNSKTVNITVDMSGSTIYGVDDLDDRIKGATKEAMREEFNDPFSVAI